jgi:hypothetical protein
MKGTVMPPDEEDKVFTIHLGIITMPMAQTNFSLSDGSNPLQEAIMQMCNEVLEMTATKLLQSAAVVCDKQGIKFLLMEDDVMREMAVQAISKHREGLDTEEFKGAMDDDGNPILDEDYFNATNKKGGYKPN